MDNQILHAITAVLLVLPIGCQRQVSRSIAETTKPELIKTLVLPEERAREARNAESIPDNEKASSDEFLLRKMKSDLRAKIPPGSQVAAARRCMEMQGFRCTLMERSDFAESEKTHRMIDYLYCDRIDEFFPVMRRWQVALVIREGAVREILVATSLRGY